MSDLTKALREQTKRSCCDCCPDEAVLYAAADELDRLGNLVAELNGVILQLNDKLEAAEGDG